MTLAVAIDVGIKNLGVCAFDFSNGQVVHWENVSLVPSGRYIPAQNVQYVRDFVNRYQFLFANASAVIVERQMRCNMRIIESLIHMLFYDRCHVVHARCVKLHYGLSTRNYRQNKVKAVEWAKEFMKQNALIFAPGTAEHFLASTKQDDLADSLLLAMFYLDTYSNQ